nr:chloride channel nucleotide sensitivea [Hymenolepis microstoma]
MATEVRFAREGVSFYENDRLLDKGKLIIKESTLDWEGENRQFSLAYPNICLHAVSSTPYGGDENVKFPHPHVYLMVDGDRVWSNGELVPPNGDTGMEIDNGESSDDEQGDYPPDDNPPTYSLRFVPTDVRDLQPIYDAIAECQALNPDAEDMSDSDFEDNAEENENGGDENGIDHVDPDNFAND